MRKKIKFKHDIRNATYKRLNIPTKTNVCKYVFMVVTTHKTITSRSIFLKLDVLTPINFTNILPNMLLLVVIVQLVREGSQNKFLNISINGAHILTTAAIQLRGY